MSVRIDPRDIEAYQKHLNSGHGVSIPPSDTWIAEHARAILLHSAGIGAQAHARLAEAFPRDLNRILQSNPFQLYTETDLVTFEQAVALYRRCETPNQASLASAAILKVLFDEARSGNLFCEGRLATQRARAISTIPLEQIDAAYRAMLARSEIIEFPVDSIHRIMLGRHAREEKRLADLILRRRQARLLPISCSEAEITQALIRAGCTTPDRSQIAAVRTALANPNSLITGGPGSGKTSILSAIASLALDRNPISSVICVSLAARIARAINVRTGIAADTIHKFLDWRDGAFTHTADNPVEVDLLFLEEAFMVDNMLLCALLEALPPTARLVIIGDPGQLEPIGRGMPVQAILETKAFPNAHLSANHRSGPGSSIPVSGRRALNGMMPLFGPDLSHVPTVSTPETLRAVLETWQKATALVGPENVQVLTATHRGPGGAKAINDAITGRETYAVGDRVMQMRNDRLSDYMNGELGHVVEIGPKHLTVVTDAGATVEYASAQPHTLAKAYCITAHKAQGLEYPYVINVFHPSGKRLHTRGLVNVGITRAKVHCTIIDQTNQLSRALTRHRASARYTLLPRFLAGENPLP